MALGRLTVGLERARSQERLRAEFQPKQPNTVPDQANQPEANAEPKFLTPVSCPKARANRTRAKPSNHGYDPVAGNRHASPVEGLFLFHDFGPGPLLDLGNAL